ncbi:PROTEIN PHOSPHATASE 2C [Salix purpurea]|uniref:protein-serine/threonine phosphatase n=1 Tax=Salix purpurea TaxID=77065 RepID=A0A9Q0WRF5_SALPP|nr:PROTEIN PHOSPHATASE 2C [Salix purpurea]
MSKNITHGFHLVKGKSHHDMEDYVVAEFKEIDDNELGLFAIFDGHLSHIIPDYLRSHLFDNILKEPNFWTEPENAMRRAYRITDTKILEKGGDLGKGGSTAVTAVLINCQKLVVANVGDSRVVICKNGVAIQLSVDHEPSTEREDIENRGGFVLTFPGDVPRVDGQLAVARAFGDKNLKEHLSSEPDVAMEMIDDETDCIILASDGLWKVMSNQEAVDTIKNIQRCADSSPCTCLIRNSERGTITPGAVKVTSSGFIFLLQENDLDLLGGPVPITMLFEWFDEPYLLCQRCPAEGGVCPSSVSMVFAVNQGMPSVARWVHLIA